MKNKKIVMFSVVMISIIALIYFIFIKGGLPFLTITPTPGGFFIPNPNDPTSPYSEIVTLSSYPCNADECIVSGSMIVDKPVEIPEVLFRTSGSYGSGMCVGYDFNNNRLLEGRTLSSSVGSQSGFAPTYIRSDGLGFKINSDGSIAVGYTGQTSWRKTGSTSCSVSPSTTPLSNCNSPEVCTTPIRYSADFNFCPSTDPNFAYCNGDQSVVDSQGPHFTDEVRLYETQTVSFDPKNGDGTDITKRTIRVKKYDLSCAPAVQDGRACSQDQKFCKPQSSGALVCPQNTTFSSSGKICVNLDGRLLSTARYIRDICYSGENCFNRIPQADDFTKYLACDSTQQIGESTCNAFGNITRTAPSGKECFLLNAQGLVTNQHGEGLGDLVCPGDVNSPDACYLGQKRPGLTQDSYQECILVGQCNRYTDRTCSSGLIYNDTAKDCVCPSENSCNPQESLCQGTLNIQTCELKPIGNKQCYQWSSTVQSCQGELKCDTKGNNYPDDSCSCEDVSTCTPGQIQCVIGDTSKYKECTVDLVNPLTSCYKFRTEKTVSDPATLECKNNEIVLRDDVGCAFNTPGYACSTLKDSNNIQLEQCTNNQCVLVNDIYTATQQQFLAQNTKCLSNVVKKVVKYEGTVGSIYRWETKSDALNALNGVCNVDFICIELLTGQAQCSPGFEFVGIIADESYGAGVLLNGLKAVVTPNYPGGCSNVPLTVRLLNALPNSEITGTRIVTQTGPSCEKVIDFNYAHPTTGEIYAEVIAGDPATSSFKTVKTIKIVKRINLLLTCPPTGIVGRDVTCTWITEDIDTGDSISTQKVITITQGVNDIDFDPSISSVKFKTDLTGSVTVKITASKDGYLSDTRTSTVIIQNPTITKMFSVDNTEYSGDALTKGVHQLKFEVIESGLPVDVQGVQADLRTPSGDLIPITFNKLANNKFVGSVNLQQAGSNYDVDGVIFFVDVAKDPQPFSYKLLTIGSGTTEDTTRTIYTIIGISVGVAVLLILILAIFLARRRKK